MLALLTVLASTAAAPADFVGQVVCSQCWFEADRTTVPYGTPSDLSCAARCAGENVPVALALKDGSAFELLPLEGRDDWSELVGSFVRIQGMVEERKDKRVLSVASAEKLAENPWGVPETAEGEPAALSWLDLGGENQSLESLRGRIVVLNFWATWCEPCRKEMPDLVRIQNRYGMYGVQVLGAAADAPGAADTVTTFARRLKINFPVLLGATTAQMQSFGLGVALPATVVIDRHGHVAARIPGVFEHKALQAVLDDLIDGSRTAKHARDEDEERHVHVARGGTSASLVPS